MSKQHGWSTILHVNAGTDVYNPIALLELFPSGAITVKAYTPKH